MCCYHPENIWPSAASSKSSLFFTLKPSEINTLIAFSPLPQPKIVKDKANHAVVLDKATQDKLQKDVQSYRLITVATLVDRLKINGSLARQSLKDLEDKGQIKKVVGHSKLSIYSKCPPSTFLSKCECQRGRGGRDKRQGNDENATCKAFGCMKENMDSRRENTKWITETWNTSANTWCFFSARAVTAAE